LGESLIDIVLAIIIGAICLIAARLIPSKEKIQRNETAKYKSSKVFIYIAGVSSLSLGILFILLYIIEKDYQRLVNILKMIVFLVIGIALISENVRK
jgi:O-antigen/teichoic acid export membrane protein